MLHIHAVLIRMTSGRALCEELYVVQVHRLRACGVYKTLGIGGGYKLGNT